MGIGTVTTLTAAPDAGILGASESNWAENPAAAVANLVGVNALIFKKSLHFNRNLHTHRFLIFRSPRCVTRTGLVALARKIWRQCPGKVIRSLELRSTVQMPSDCLRNLRDISWTQLYVSSFPS